MMPRMNILVTGAAGFMGMHVAQRLLAQGGAVCGWVQGVSRLSCGALMARCADQSQVGLMR